MSILNRIDTNDTRSKVQALRESKLASGIAHAHSVLTESSLGKRCPNLVKGLESSDMESKYKAATMVQLIENTAGYVAQQGGMQLLKEDASSTTAVSLLTPGVSSLTPRTVDIVNVFYPKMCAQYFCDIQALDRQSGQIFVIKTRYSQTGSGVTAGDIVFEKPTDGTYASEFIAYGTATIAASVTATPTAIPAGATVKIRAGSFQVKLAGRTIARDYGNGEAGVNGVNTGAYIVMGKGVSGSVNAQTGVGTLTFNATMYATEIANSATLSFEAAYDSETDTDLIKRIQFDVPNQPILAKEHPLLSSYSVAAGLVMNAHLAIDIDELISNQLAGTIRWERDLVAIKAVADAAKLESALTFDCSANGANLTLKQRYESYTTTVSTARGLIQANAGRGTVDFIICSASQGLTVMEQIEGFKAAPEAKKPVGPYLAGTLREGTINVIAVPYASGVLAADQVIFGFKGFQLGDSSIVLAEWVPLFHSNIPSS